MPFEGVLVEAYKDTRRKHNMKFRRIGHITIVSTDSHFFEFLLKFCYWLYLYLIFLNIRVYPFRIMSCKGSVE